MDARLSQVGSGTTESSGTILAENTTIWEKISLKVAHQVLAKKLGKDVIVAVVDTGVDTPPPGTTSFLKTRIHRKLKVQLSDTAQYRAANCA
ncbi:MAG: hypothetical protein ACRCYY_02170 [Trueperaceae bacterium]